MVSLSQSGINNTESKANRTGARFKWQCATIYSSVYNLCNPRGGKTANPADGEDSRTIRPNTCSAHLGRSITKQPAHRPQRAHVRHQSQAQKEAGGKPGLQTAPPVLAQPTYFNYHKQTQRLRQRKTITNLRLALAAPLECTIIYDIFTRLLWYINIRQNFILKRPMLILLFVAIIISLQLSRLNVAGCIYLRRKKEIELNWWTFWGRFLGITGMDV